LIRQGILVFEDTAEGVLRTAQRFGGLSILDRGIRTMARAGCERILVVVPEGARRRVSRLPRKLSAQVEVVIWGSAPTLTFFPDEGYLLLHGDYTHHHSSLTKMVEDGRRQADLVIQTAGDGGQMTPLTEVNCDASVVTFRPADSETSGAVSTGVFLCGASLSPSELPTTTDDLFTFLSVRSAGRQLETRPVTSAPALWQRVVDRRSARAAKTMLFSQVTKSTSGPVSRHINAKFSIPTSKLLIETGISPHMVTVLLVMTAGLSAAYFISRGDEYVCFALAGILWQLAAIFDRCDGEIARVKLAESKFGAWFDTVTDNIAYLCAYAGMLVTVDRILDPWYLNLAFSAAIAILVSLTVMYAYAIKTGSGSLQRYLVGFSQHVPDEQKGHIYRWMERYSFVAKRDFFSFVYFVLCLTNQFELLYWFTVGGAHLMALGVLLSQRKMLEGHRSINGDQQPSSVPALNPLGAASQTRDG